MDTAWTKKATGDGTIYIKPSSADPEKNWTVEEGSKGAALMNPDGETVDENFETPMDAASYVFDQENQAMKTRIESAEKLEDALHEQAKRVAELESEFDKRKRAAKAAKDDLDAAMTALYKLCLPGAEAPLFEQGEGNGEAWREKDIKLLLDHGLTDALLEKLVETGIRTMGQYSDASAQQGGLGIKGVGEAKADQINEAFIDWCAKNKAFWEDEEGEEEDTE